MTNSNFKVLLSYEDIQKRVKELAEQITLDYSSVDNSFNFLTRLIRKLAGSEAKLAASFLICSVSFKFLLAMLFAS